ncbi:hypothetical protein J3E72DRAFT_306147, partial [Bipolaris maydis]|uniref:uncharacterized protein n=1 Tax=Cochliobolus heterostrophus TaxID=5016 RepID=UPI0024D79B4A
MLVCIFLFAIFPLIPCYLDTTRHTSNLLDTVVWRDTPFALLGVLIAYPLTLPVQALSGPCLF